MPTPTAADSAASGGSSPSGVTLTDAVVRTDMGRTPNPRHEAQRLLPTPTAFACEADSPARSGGGGGPGLSQVIVHNELRPSSGPNQRGSSGDLMLPGVVQGLGEKCPTCGCSIDYHDADGFCAGPCGGNRFECYGRTDDDAPLPTPVHDIRSEKTLLPTPMAVTRERTPEEMIKRTEKRVSGEMPSSINLDEVPFFGFGDYAPAIARWENVLGRPAPAPTEPGPKGSPRLSARFVEWMMGLPAGHVTGVDIPRNAQLKALGNGVVPQQAAAAARWWLAQIQETAA